MHYEGRWQYSVDDGSIRSRTVNLTISSRRGGGARMRRRLLFLIHFCCPAASPINQSGSRGQTGNESAHSPSAFWLYVCVCGRWRNEQEWCTYMWQRQRERVFKGERVKPWQHAGKGAGLMRVAWKWPLLHVCAVHQHLCLQWRLLLARSKTSHPG